MKGQVWIETVIYTLIGLALIGLVLGIVTPRINDFRDRAAIEQTISSLNEIDSKINEVLAGGNGNARIIEFIMKKGELFFDKDLDLIYYILDDSSIIYSEPGIETFIGNVKVITTEGVKEHEVRLELNYGFDIHFEGDPVMKFSRSSTPYKFRFEKNSSGQDNQVIFSEIS